MATHRITLTSVGSGISATLDLYRWNGSAWVSHKTGIAKTALVAGYEFDDDDTGATQFQLRDKGTCGTTLTLECEGEPPTTTVEATTTELPTTTLDGTTTALPTTTEEVLYATWWTTANTGNCGDPCGQQKYTPIALAGSPLTVSYFFNTSSLIPADYYAPGTGTIGFTDESFGNAKYIADLAIDGALSNNANCPV